MYKTRSMEDEILKIMAAEIAGENVTKEEREKMNRWWEEKRGNERTYKMLMGEFLTSSLQKPLFYNYLINRIL